MHNFGRSTIVLIMLALAGGVSGCAIRLPQLPFGRSDPAPAESGQGQPPSGTMPRPSAMAGMPQPDGGNTLPPIHRPEPHAENAITSSFKKAARSVGDALTIKPKVVKAHDPTSLATATGPVGPDLYVSAAQLAENHSDFDTARGHYEKALEIEPGCLPALIGLSRLYHRLGQMDRAAEYSLQAVQAHPENPVARNDLGLCYARQRQFEPAIESLSWAVQLQPDSKLYRNNLAAALVLAGRNDEALMHLNQAHGASIAYYNLGFLLYKQGKTNESRECFQLALQADPELRSAAQMLMRLRSQAPTPLVQQSEPDRNFRDPGPTLRQQSVPQPESAPALPPIRDEIYVRSHRLPPVTDDTQPLPAPVAPPVAGQYSLPPLSGQPDAPAVSQQPEATSDRNSAWPELPGPNGERTPELPQNLPPILTPEEAARQGLNEPPPQRQFSDGANGHLTEFAPGFDQPPASDRPSGSNQPPADGNRLKLNLPPPPPAETMRSPDTDFALPPVSDAGPPSGRGSRFSPLAPQEPETPRLPPIVEPPANGFGDPQGVPPNGTPDQPDRIGAGAEPPNQPPEKQPWWEQELPDSAPHPKDTNLESQLRFPSSDPGRGETRPLDTPPVPPQPSGTRLPPPRPQTYELWPATPG